MKLMFERGPTARLPIGASEVGNDHTTPQERRQTSSAARPDLQKNICGRIG